MKDILRPSPDELMDVMDDVINILKELTFVQKIICFGSLARGDWDRWSDIDLLVVVNTRSHYVDLLQYLQHTKPILHRNHFVSQVEPSGGHVLGIIFQGDSVFHCIDLNLLSHLEYLTTNSLDRFGIIKELFSRLPSVSDGQDFSEVFSEEEDSDEARIKSAIHFTKKAVKKVLRGESSGDVLLQRVTHLKQVMTDYPSDLIIDGRHIGHLAHIYIEMSELLLQEQTKE